MSNKQARSNLDSPIPNNYDFSNVSSSRNEIDLFEILVLYLNQSSR